MPDKKTSPKAAKAASKTLRDDRTSKSSKSLAASALSQSGRRFSRTKDGVEIYKPASGATHFSAREMRRAVSDARKSG